MKPLVLVIAKDKEESENIEKMINKSYAIMSTTSAEDALALFAMASTTIKVVLLDLDISGTDGVQLFQELRQISSMPEFIALSDSKESKLAIRVMKLGAFDFLEKPLTSCKLLNSLHNTGKYSDVLQRMALNFSTAFYKNVESRISKVKELMQQRFKQDKEVSDQEIQSLFEPEEVQEGLTTDVVKEIVSRQVRKEENKFPKILVVEDEEEMRENLCEILLREYDLVLAKDGNEALEKIKQEPDIDLILLDIILPGKRGIDLMEDFKKLLPEVEIVMLTAFPQREYIVDSFQQEAYDYVTKPFNVDNLFATIARALQKKYFQKALPDIGKHQLIQNIPENKKTIILNSIAQQREDEGKQLLMEDIYLFFPELQKCGLAADHKIPNEVTEDGVLYFIESLQENINSEK